MTSRLLPLGGKPAGVVGDRTFRPLDALLGLLLTGALALGISLLVLWVIDGQPCAREEMRFPYHAPHRWLSR